ncbi:MAG: hypothetical protein RLZZ175_2358 [Bacteroidota bacterium]|jgi:hypothetical protein
MNNEDIEKIISTIDNSVNPNTALIEFWDSHQLQDLDLNLFGNKDGLLLFANHLLKTSLMIDENEKLEGLTIPLNLDKQKWYNQNSEFINNFKFREFEDDGENNKDKYNQTSITNSILKYGCLATVVLILVSIIVGVQTIFHWFYK